MDHLCDAYMAVDSKRGNNDSGLSGSEYMRLINMLCLDFPSEIIDEVMAVYAKRENDIIPFEDFAAGIQSVMMYDEFFEEAERLFNHLDVHCKGKVLLSTFHSAIDKLMHYNIDILLPTREELDEVFAGTRDREISFPDFAIALFKATI